MRLTHVNVAMPPGREADARRSYGNLSALPADRGRPALWIRFSVHDPLGNKVGFHEKGGLRG